MIDATRTLANPNDPSETWRNDPSETWRNGNGCGCGDNGDVTIGNGRGNLGTLDGNGCGMDYLEFESATPPEVLS